MIRHDLEKHTVVYIMSHGWQCISEQKPSYEVEGNISLNVNHFLKAYLILIYCKSWDDLYLPFTGNNSEHTFLNIHNT